MSEAWYIDALDGLSGLAFASFRPASLNQAEFNLDGAAWFISAPGFRPEMVASRTMAFAATRRSFQLGLSLDGETEVAFPTLDALSEYVRRLYLAGGGSDGAGGVGPVPPAPPDGEGPSLEGLREFRVGTGEEGSFHASKLLRFAESFLTQSTRLSTGDKTATGIERLSINSIERTLKPSSEPTSLHDAAELIAATLATANRGRDAHEREIWQDALAGFHHLVISMYLDFPWAKNIRSLFPKLHRRAISTKSGIDVLLIGSWCNSHGSLDPLDTLARLPIPGDVGKNGGSTENWRSLKDLFYGILGQPRSLIETQFSAERAALFLFAAATLIAHVKPVPLDRARKERRDLHAVLMTNALEWIALQLPNHAFASDLEDKIGMAVRPTATERGA